MNHSKTWISATLIIFLLLPAGLFSSSKIEPENPTPSLQSVSGLNSVRVTTASPTAQIASSAALSCDSGAATRINLVQDTGLINFNQPANCFTIYQSPVALQPYLTVGMARTPGTIALAEQPNAVWNHLRGAEPVEPAVPMLPTASTALIITFTSLALAVPRLRLKRATNSIANALTLSQLQVRQC